jgi:hypothetical protein
MLTRTTFEYPKSNINWTHNTPIVTMGSCFSEHIANKLEYYRMDCLNNPFGTTFNPLSIVALIEQSINNQYQPFLLHTDDLVFDYGLHSKFAAANSIQLENIINTLFAESHGFLKKENCTLILTLGTAWAYKHIETNQIVSNCHKQPGKLFEKKLLTLEEMENAFASIFLKLKAFNPSLKCILTVSPVRHTKDTIPNNMLSKSLLRVLCHSLQNKYKEFVTYFPSYEFMMDDLRDYRYYESDLIHPNQQAIDYIWSHFVRWMMPTNMIDAMKEWDEIQAGLLHKPHHEFSKSYQLFLSQLHKRLLQFKHWPCMPEIMRVEEKIEHALKK